MCVFSTNLISYFLFLSQFRDTPKPRPPELTNKEIVVEKILAKQTLQKTPMMKRKNLAKMLSDTSIVFQVIKPPAETKPISKEGQPISHIAKSNIIVTIRDCAAKQASSPLKPRSLLRDLDAEESV